MANRFQVGMNRLKQHFLNNAAVSITYHKVDADGTDTPILLTTWIGNTFFKVLDKNGQRLEWGDRDYLIPVEALAIGIVPFEPAKGHYITETVNLTTITYELSAPENEKVWRFSDPQHLVYRIHTKKTVIVP